MPSYAVIDVGSNSIVLSTYEASPSVGESYQLTHYQSNTARLASYVEDGIMSAEGIRKAAEVIGEYLALIPHIPCENIGIFATAAIRNSENRAEVVDFVQRQCGHKVAILAGEEEAHLSFVGAASENPVETGLLVDMGGASTELTLIEDGADALSVSMPFGALAVANRFIEGDLPTTQEIDAISNATRQHLDSLDPRFNANEGILIGSSGSVRSALRMAESDGNALLARDAERLVRLAQEDPKAFKALIELYAPKRLRTAAPGCIVLLEIMKWARADSILVSANGVREGYLIERLLRPAI